MKIDPDLETKTLTILKSVYAQKVLEFIGMQDCKSTATPIAKNLNHVTNLEIAKPLSVRKYQSAIEILIYAMIQTCPNLAYSISIFSKFSTKPLK